MPTALQAAVQPTWRHTGPGYYVATGGLYVRWDEDAGPPHNRGLWAYGTKRRSSHCLHGHKVLLLEARMAAEGLLA